MLETTSAFAFCDCETELESKFMLLALIGNLKTLLRISSFRRLVGIAKRKVLALSASSERLVVDDDSDELDDDEDEEESELWEETSLFCTS